MDNREGEVANAPSSNRDCAAEAKNDESTKVAPKKMCFTGPIWYQNFSIPDSLIYRIIMNPSSLKIYQKLIQSCKYFFARNSVSVTERLHEITTYHQSTWDIYHILENEQTTTDPVKLQDCMNKIWITGLLSISEDYQYDQEFKSFLSANIIPKIFQCDAKFIDIFDQNLSFDEFVFISSKAERIDLDFVIVKNQNGSVVPLENLIEALPNVKDIRYVDNNLDSFISKKTVANLFQIPHFSKIGHFWLCNAPAIFDVQPLFNYMKKNKFTFFVVEYSLLLTVISVQYKNRIKAIIDEIIATEAPDYRPPRFTFDGIDQERLTKMETSPASSNRECAVESKNNESTSVSPKKIYFSGPARYQIWSIPDSMIYRITMNPSSAKLYRKLLRSCKYFFAKNSILVAERLHEITTYHQSTWNIYHILENEQTIKDSVKLQDCLNKIWITYLVYICEEGQLSKSFLSADIIPKIYRCDAESVSILKQHLSFDEFLFISSKAEKIYLNHVIIMKQDGSVVPLENIVEALPNIKNIHCVDNNLFSLISSKTVKNLFKIPHFSKLRYFWLFNAPEIFDVQMLVNYMKENKYNKYAKFYVEYSFLFNVISEEYKTQIEVIIDEIIATEFHSYRPPMLVFVGLDHEKYLKMEQRHNMS